MSFSTFDITPDVLAEIQPERIGFAVRNWDGRLLDEINKHLDSAFESIRSSARSRTTPSYHYLLDYLPLERRKPEE